MSAGYRVAVIGASRLIGRHIVAALYERAFPVASLRLYDETSCRGEQVDFGERSAIVEAVEDGIEACDVAFVADGGFNPREVEAFGGGEAMVVDCSDQCALDDDVPLIVPECNVDALDAVGSSRVVASPDPVAVGLSVALMPLYEHAGIRRAVVTAMESVSEAGELGIEELSRQTVGLLNGRSIDLEIFPSRIAFNALPWMGTARGGMDTVAEERAAAHLRKILADPSVELSLTRVYVPTFYGTGLAVNLELGRPVDVSEAHNLLRVSPGILIADAEGGLPSSLADAVEQDATLISRVRRDPSVENGLNLWVAIDNLRKGHAVNAVQIAEILLRG